jgi:hypothetical protein
MCCCASFYYLCIHDNQVIEWLAMLQASMKSLWAKYDSWLYRTREVILLLSIDQAVHYQASCVEVQDLLILYPATNFCDQFMVKLAPLS